MHTIRGRWGKRNVFKSYSDRNESVAIKKKFKIRQSYADKKILCAIRAQQDGNESNHRIVAQP